MGWKSWFRRKESEASAAICRISEQLTGLEEQVSKLTRIQYKTSQDSLSKIDRISASLDSVLQWQDARSEESRKLDSLRQQLDEAAQSMIRWLDDLDLVRERIQGEEQAAWRQVLEQWTKQLLAALHSVGIRELDVFGRSFDPRVAESISRVSLDTVYGSSLRDENQRNPMPYEVVSVMKRGFVSEDGRLLRKAQVITLEEEENQSV